MKTALHQVILHILRPLVRILLRKGIAFGAFSQLARKTYVEAAEEALLKAGEKATTSRIAIATGLTRKEVAQLRQADTEVLGSSMRYGRGVRVIGGWMNDADFLDADGAPLALLPQGELPSFEQLVARYSGDMPYKAMLKELLHSGGVSQQPDGLLNLMADAYIPQADEEEKLTILGSDVHLLISTIEHNLTASATERHFQRKVSYDNLPEDAMSEFKQLANQDSMALLVRLDQWLAAHDRDSNPQVAGHGRMRAGVGVYYFEESLTPPAKDKDSTDVV